MNRRRGELQTSISDTFKAVSRLLIKESRLDPLLKNLAEQLKSDRLFNDVFIWVAAKDNKTETAWGTATAPLSVKNLFLTRPQPACIQAVADHGAPLTCIRDDNECLACPVCPICPGWASLVIPLVFKQEFYGILFVTLPSEVIAVNTEVAFLVEVGENIAACLYRMNQESLYRATATALLKRSLELNYFHNFARISEQPDTDLETILQRGVDLIPASMARPDLAAAALVLTDTGQRFATPNFTRGLPMVENPVLVSGKSVGMLTVCYPGRPQGPDLTFLKEEEKLMGSISLRMGKIIERKRGRIALERSEQRFRDLTNNAVTGIAILQNDQIVFQNPEYKKIFGPLSHSPELFLDARVHPDDKQKVQLFHGTITRHDFTTLCVDFRITPPPSLDDNNSRITSVFCRAAMTEFREKPAILLNVMDMTKPRELENLLRIQDKMTSLGRVAAGIAHEIRNPLSGINIYLKSLEKYALERNAEAEGKIISKIQSASNRIESVIKRVMDFSKPGELKPISVDVNTPVQNAIDLAAVTLRKSGVKIETDLGTALPLCRLDSHMIEQVMLNLITNAAEAMKTLAPDTKTIAVTTGCLDPQQVVIQVEDSGPGISQIHRERIFDPFYTTKNSSGIGLSICRRIINDHKGNLNLHKSRLGGAGFRIQLPAEQHKFKPAKGV